MAAPFAGRTSRRSGPALAVVERLLAFHRGLVETGDIEGKNVAIEYRWAENQNDRLPARKI
jgi:putative ABC transport system substrate-binding protein